MFSWTITHQAVDPAFADAWPYATVVVELDEGPRLVALSRAIAAAWPSTVPSWSGSIPRNPALAC